MKSNTYFKIIAKLVACVIGCGPIELEPRKRDLLRLRLRCCWSLLLHWFIGANRLLDLRGNAFGVFSLPG